MQNSISHFSPKLTWTPTRFLKTSGPYLSQDSQPRTRVIGKSRTQTFGHAPPSNCEPRQNLNIFRCVRNSFIIILFQRHINLCNRYGKNGLFFPLAQNAGRCRLCEPKAQLRHAPGYLVLLISPQDLIEARLKWVFKWINFILF